MLILIIDVFVCITDKENNIKRKKNPLHGQENLP